MEAHVSQIFDNTSVASTRFINECSLANELLLIGQRNRVLLSFPQLRTLLPPYIETDKVAVKFKGDKFQLEYLPMSNAL